METMNNEFSYSNKESTPSSDLLLTKETIDTTVDTLSEHMVVNIPKLLEDPEDGEWGSSDFLKCVEFPDDIYKYVNVPGLDFKELVENPNLSNVEDITDRDSKIELLLFTEAMLNTAIGGIENIDREYKLRELIDDIHPEWSYELNSIKKDLRELTNKVSESKDKNRPLSSYLTSYKRKAYNILTILSMTAGMLSACNPVQGTESSDIDGNEKPTATQTISPTATQSPTPTVTPSPIPTETPTSTPTEIPTPTPMVEGNIEVFSEEIEEGDVIWNILEFQQIINDYNPNADTSLSEFLNQKQGQIEDKRNYEKVIVMLEEMKQFKNIDDITLAKTLQNGLPELEMINVTWSDTVLELFPRPVTGFVSLQSEWFEEGLRFANSYNDGIYTVGDFPISWFQIGDLVFNTDTYQSLSQEEDMEMYVVISVKRDSTGDKLLVATSDQDKIKLIIVDNSNIGEYFGQKARSFIGRTRPMKGE
jgi:hypothetical protein